jgi:hypothetical protein
MKIIEGRVRLAASDVANFLACRRLTQLDLLRARGTTGPSLVAALRQGLAVACDKPFAPDAGSARQTVFDRNCPM